MTNEAEKAAPASPEKDYIGIVEFARRIGKSPDTIRRHIKNGKLGDIVWIDFLGTGQLSTSRDDAESFISSKRSAAQQVYSQSSRKSRG